MAFNDYPVIGWDIGGVNIKAVLLECKKRKIITFHTVVRPFEIWREPDNLTMVLRDIAEELGIQDLQNAGVTMTAELSDVFRTKREGVLYVLDAIKKAFSKAPIHLFNLEGGFFRIDEAKKNPLQCAATNWLASANFIAVDHPDCILMDIGSTTTDIIPIRKGKVISQGRNDTQRLTSGELVYTGILRTNPNTIVNRVPSAGRTCRVAAEYFTCMADVYLVLGQIVAEGYTCPTTDGKIKTISAARDRLARLVCSDGEIMGADEIDALARYLWEKQLQQIVDSLFQVLSGLQGGFGLPLAMVGTGEFLAKEAARRLGMQTVELRRKWDDRALASFPALAVAYLLTEKLAKEVNPWKR